jgi:peroxiredoxin
MYAQVFKGGKNVVLIGISADSPEDLASWAADDDFPFLMATDADWSVAESYGVPLRENGFLGSRSVVVVDPDGKIAWSVQQFRQADPMAYDELQAAIEAVTPEEEGDGS